MRVNADLNSKASFRFELHLAGPLKRSLNHPAMTDEICRASVLSSTAITPWSPWPTTYCIMLFAET